MFSLGVSPSSRSGFLLVFMENLQPCSSNSAVQSTATLLALISSRQERRLAESITHTLHSHLFLLDGCYLQQADKKGSTPAVGPLQPSSPTDTHQRTSIRQHVWEGHGQPGAPPGCWTARIHAATPELKGAASSACNEGLHLKH